ncbi:hypothetical protein FXO37_14881 [Capsicum annuum]|nr:hypothetical protein FXO37_14881 [Capsicum annuum]
MGIVSRHQNICKKLNSTLCLTSELGGTPYNSIIPQAIWNLPLIRRPSPQSKFSAKVGVYDYDTPEGTIPTYNPYLGHNTPEFSNELSKLVPSGQGVSKQKGQLMRNLIVVISCPRIVLSGVLYHPHQQAPSSSSKLATKNFNAVVPYNPLPQHHSGRRNRRKNGYPNRPKANRSGYNFFFAENMSCSNLFIHINGGNSQNDWRILEQSFFRRKNDGFVSNFTPVITSETLPY